MPTTKRPWIGPLSTAPADVLDRLRTAPTFQTLIAHGWDPAKTLLYVPVHAETFDADICIVGRTFAWDDSSPIIWLFSTIGLSRIAQTPQPGRAAFRRFELVVATNNAEREDPFPSRLGVVLAQGSEQLPGWDWRQVTPPPLLQWLVLAAQDVASWMIRDHSHFAPTDTLPIGPGNSSWTRSLLSRSVFLPATPHMLAVGLRPFNIPGDEVAAAKAGDWHRTDGIDRFEYGFQWLLPVSEAEYQRANSSGTWNMFADLVERSPAEARDDCAVAFDWLR